MVLLVLLVLEDLYLLGVLLGLLLQRDQLVLEVRCRHQALEGRDCLQVLEVLEVLGLHLGLVVLGFLPDLPLPVLPEAHRLLFLLL